MNDVITYFIQVSVGIGLFYGVYSMFLKNLTFFKTNRYFFLLGMLVSILLPLIKINIQDVEKVNYMFFLNEIFVIASEPTTNTLDEIVIVAPRLVNPFIFYSIIVYLIGVAFFSFKTLIDFDKILTIAEKAKFRYRKNHICVVTDQKVSPFSFFRYLVVDKKTFNSDKFDEIKKHELVHIKQKHSVDIIIAEIICCLFWFIPFTWLIKNKIKQNHEYIVDNCVVNSGISVAKYQELIINFAYGNQVISIANNFNKSTIFKRVLMLSKSKLPKYHLIKYFIVLPCLLVIFSFTFKKNVKVEKVLKTNDEEIIKLVSEKIDHIEPIEVNPKKEEIKELKSRRTKFEFSPKKEIYNNKKVEIKRKKVETFVVVDDMPVYPGGHLQLQKDIAKAIVYPKEAVLGNISGRVFVTFVVDFKGNIINSKVVRGVNPILDKEAIRVVNSLKKWKPGTQRGEPVNVSFTIPINFDLKE